MPQVPLTTREEVSLRHILETPVSSRPTLPDDVHDALVEKGHLRWVGGILVVTLEGIAALSEHRKRMQSGG